MKLMGSEIAVPRKDAGTRSLLGIHQQHGCEIRSNPTWRTSSPRPHMVTAHVPGASSEEP